MPVGIVDVRDLEHRYAWDPPRITALVAAAGMVPGSEQRHSFEPPDVLVAIVPYETPERVFGAPAWIRLARRLIVVRDCRTAAEQVAWPAAELGVEVHDWHVDADLAPILARARALAVPDVRAPDVRDRAIRELPTGAWITLDTNTRHGDRLSLLGWKIHELDLEAPQLRAHRDYPLPRTWPISTGADPADPIRWRGHRMAFHWFYNDLLLCKATHDWPCGPAKKLYGHEDNDPVQICMSPMLDACVARFDHDVLFTTEVPIRWTRAGDFELALFQLDPRRALFFAREREHLYDVADEDTRDHAPALVLGPGCYALDLNAEVYSVRRTSTHEGEPVYVGGPDAGYAVFDFDHRLLRRASGHLLGGYYQHATIAHHGAYWREDLATGERVPLAPIDLARAVDPTDEAVARDAMLEGRHDAAAEIHANRPAQPIGDIDVIAIPGTRNVLLVAAGAIRVI